MTDSTPLLILLGMTSVCLLVATAALIVAVAELRGTLRRVNRVLPEARATFRELHHLLGRANSASRHIEAVVHHACEAASDALDRVSHFGGDAERFFTKRFGNGAGAGPRRHHRSG